MSEPTASPLIGHDDSHFTPVALNGVPAPQPAAQADEAKVYQTAVKLLSGQSAPPPAPQPAEAGKKTLAQIADEILSGGE